MSRATPHWSEQDLEAAKQRMMVRGGAKEHGSDVRCHARVGKNAVAEKPHPASSLAGADKQNRRDRAGSNPAHAPHAQQFFVPGPLPGQNTFMGKGSRWTYKKAKKEWAKRIGMDIAQAKLRPMRRVQIAWQWQERNRRRDPDNFTGISKKFILDTLVGAGILPDDGWDEIAGWTDHWMVDATNPGVLVILREVP